MLGQAWDLRHPSSNEIEKAKYQVAENALLGLKQSIIWPDPALNDRTITRAEYDNAKDRGRIWVTLDAKVFDVTEFLADHPGGSALLQAMASRPPDFIASQYAQRHTHSRAARNLLDTMLIGTLV